ncbi:MAG: methyltransferase [Myxococcales bacterium FL481]|nr:MAG: methyltransferase [Myxococcales bacterium FL481]
MSPATRRELADVVVAALSRGDAGVARALIRRVQGRVPEDLDVRAPCLAALGRLAHRVDETAFEGLEAALLEALGDPDPHVVREAARAVAKVPVEDHVRIEARLLEIIDRVAVPERRAVVDGLAVVGSERASAWLHAVSGGDDSDFARRAARAGLLIERRAARVGPAVIVRDRVLGSPHRVCLRGRRGTAGIVFDQAERSLPPSLAGATEIRDERSVVVNWAGDYAGLLAVRTGGEVGLEFPLPNAGDLTARIVAGLSAPALEAALRAWTDGELRFRLAFAQGGHRRQIVWDVATRLAQHHCPLRNDSRNVPWTIEVDEVGEGRLLCLPRGADDRFEYRLGDVPAASHPSLAAALAWTARPRAGELVWDPFCGSGSELVECARLQPDLTLCGTDVAEAAIEVARRNTTAAGLDPRRVHLHRGEAGSTRPGDGSTRPSLVITNPPMGGRVAGDGSVRELLVGLVHRCGRALAPGGRLVWLTPSPQRTREAAHAVGLVVEERTEIDMGGFPATLQIITRPA